VRHASNGTFFHFQKFFEYHPPDRFEMCHLVFREKGHMVAVWPGAVRDEDGLKSWTSHPGASYGGLLLRPDIGVRDAHRIVHDLIYTAKSEGIERLRLTPPPSIYHRYPNDLVEFILLRAGFQFLKQDLTQAVDLTILPIDENDIIARYDNKTRTAVRKALKEGVEVRHDLPLSGEPLEQFYDILVRNRKRLGVTPTHTQHELKILGEIAPKYMDLAMAYVDDRPIAGILNFICNEKVMLEFYIAHNASDQQYRPAPLLVHETVVRAKRRGFHWLDFGISTEGGNRVTWGLAKFKENFSCQGFLRNTLVMDTVQEWEPPEGFMPPVPIRQDVR
jgi:hypothetical protein